MTGRKSFPAPAKLNLFLHVLGRRADGYHLLQTAFTFIDLCDELTFRVREDSRIERITPWPQVSEQDDLSVRAARLLQRSTDCKRGVSISLLKRIPLGAGLGGGSSDAATTLVALNRLWDLNLRREELRELALKLGADVPVFIFGESAFAEGIGERLMPLAVAPVWYLVLTTEVHVSTKEIFESADLTRNMIPITINGFSVEDGRNDLEPVVCRRYPEVGDHLKWLKQFAPARMTGSGGAVFGRFASQAAAEAIFAHKPASWSGLVVRGLERHPLKSF